MPPSTRWIASGAAIAAAFIFGLSALYDLAREDARLRVAGLPAVPADGTLGGTDLAEVAASVDESSVDSAVSGVLNPEAPVTTAPPAADRGPDREAEGPPAVPSDGTSGETGAGEVAAAVDESGTEPAVNSVLDPEVPATAAPSAADRGRDREAGGPPATPSDGTPGETGAGEIAAAVGEGSTGPAVSGVLDPEVPVTAAPSAADRGPDREVRGSAAGSVAAAGETGPAPSANDAGPEETNGPVPEPAPETAETESGIPEGPDRTASAARVSSDGEPPADSAAVPGASTAPVPDGVSSAREGAAGSVAVPDPEGPVAAEVDAGSTGSVTAPETSTTTIAAQEDAPAVRGAVRSEAPAPRPAIESGNVAAEAGARAVPDPSTGRELPATGPETVGSSPSVPDASGSDHEVQPEAAAAVQTDEGAPGLRRDNPSALRHDAAPAESSREESASVRPEEGIGTETEGGAAVGAPEVGRIAALPEPVRDESPVPGSEGDSPPGARLPAPEGLVEFDVVQVSPDGTLVIAGRTPSGSRAELMVDGDVVDTADITGNGEFVFVPAAPLRPGVRELSVAIPAADGLDRQVASRIVVVLIPDRDARDDRTASPAAPAPSDTPIALLVDEQGETVGVIQPSPRMAGTGAALSLATVTFDEDGYASITGRGKVGQRVAVYLDNEAMGSGPVTEEGYWTVRLRRPLPKTGSYELRIDQTEADGDVVTERIVTTLTRAGGRLIPAVATVVTVEKGMTLWGISRHHYGRGILYTLIYDSNSYQIADPHWIYPGQKFLIPERQ